MVGPGEVDEELEPEVKEECEAKYGEIVKVCKILETVSKCIICLIPDLLRICKIYV